MIIRMHSLKAKLFASLVLLVIPILVLLTLQNRYATSVVREQAADSTRTVISFYMERTDRDLLDVVEYLRTLLVTNPELNTMESTIRDDEYALAKIRLSNTLARDMLLYRSIDSVFVFVESRADYLEMSLAGNSADIYDERMAVRSEIIRKQASASPSAPRTAYQWRLATIAKQHYLIHEIKAGGIVAGAWVNLGRLIAPMRKVDLGKKGRILFEAEGGRTFSSSPERGGGAAEGSESGKRPGGAILRMASASRSGPISLVAQVSDDEILRRLPYFQLLIGLVTFGAALFLPVYFLIVRRTVLCPLSVILAGTMRVHSGDLDGRVESIRSSAEFEQLAVGFNEMLDRIQKLKIGMYEEKLAKQNAEFQRLKAQIKPHFFLNSLNVIYHLAQLGRTERIQTLVMDMVGYFRFMLRDDRDTIILREEIELVRAYLRIQSVRNPEALVADIEVDPEAEGFEVPPLCVHTFADNAVKYAVTMDEPIHLHISARMETGDCLRIEVRDDGAGYPPEVLATITAGERITDAEGEHIGIWNLRRRLELLYRDRDCLSCSNAEGGGARAVLQLPRRFSANPPPEF